MTDHEGNITPEKSEPRIDLFFTPAALHSERLKGYKAVVIDVLRAAASITMALNNGARDVIPVESIENAIDLSKGLKREDILLCGEREGKLIEGFHLGNSPSDYSRERVRGRTLIFASNNGSPAIVRASIARSVYLSGFINLNAVIDALGSQEELLPLAVVCAGKSDQFAVEDAVCAGLFIKRLLKKLSIKPRLNDAAFAAELLYREFGKDLQQMVRDCDHGKYLISIGMENDLQLCASDSVLPVVPVLKDGKLVQIKQNKKES